jgi:DNA-directed RNA polymerase subunit RPC12/RpoP
MGYTEYVCDQCGSYNVIGDQLEKNINNQRLTFCSKKCFEQYMVIDND